MLQLVLTGGELGRFFVNSTAGLLGFFNPAKGDPALNPPEEEDRRLGILKKNCLGSL
jgi:ABC-type transporter lipoprotein component MlaA